MLNTMAAEVVVVVLVGSTSISSAELLRTHISLTGIQKFEIWLHDKTTLWSPVKFAGLFIIFKSVVKGNLFYIFNFTTMFSHFSCR